MDAELLAQARDLLAQASVIAEASCSRLDSHKSKHKPDSTIPRANGMSTHDYFALRIQGCRSDRALREAVKAFEQELKEIRLYQGKGPETPAQFRFRLVDQYEGKNYRVVAHAENVSVAYVRKIRQEAGRDTLLGRKIAA